MPKIFIGAEKIDPTNPEIRQINRLNLFKFYIVKDIINKFWCTHASPRHL
jgi:hypothetical protein